MPPDLFPLSPLESRASLNLHRWRLFLRSTGALRIGFFTSLLFTGLMFHVTFFSPSQRFQDWHYRGHLEPVDPNGSLLIDAKLATSLPNLTPESIIPDNPPPPSPSSSPVSDVLSLEQIKDIVAPTRGFFSRDYDLGLGWNNVRYIIEAAILQAELLNRTLVIPSFYYARGCEYNITVCADYATMVNRGDAVGLDEWRELPMEEQMGFRIPISLIVNMTHLRHRQPVITAAEYLRLHGQDPETESSSGFWPRDSYHTHPNAFETSKAKTPSLFVIENHWYSPEGTTRVDYIPEAMKRRGNLERHPGPHNYDGDTEYWPPLNRTELSRMLGQARPPRKECVDWHTAKNRVRMSGLGEEANLDDDRVLEEILNAHGWEVLHTFPTVPVDIYDMAKIVVGHLKQVVPRSSIRGFKDDYHDEDADVIVLAGQTHVHTKPGAMVFTEQMARKRYASMVVHTLIPPQKVFDLAEVLASRMRLRTDGRMWVGAHMRRKDFIRHRWTVGGPQAHVQRVKKRLRAGRSSLADLHNRGDWTTWDIEDVQPCPEQTAFLPPRSGDPFFVATDERDPDARRKIADAGAIFVSDLLTIEDHRAFGWSLMITDVVALVEQEVLVYSSFFCGNAMSSFGGVIVNLRASRGADPRTMILD